VKDLIKLNQPLEITCILGFIRKIDNFFNDLISPVLALHAAKDAAFASTGARTPKVDLRLK
jgi:hypothetical protein